MRTVCGGSDPLFVFLCGADVRLMLETLFSSRFPRPEPDWEGLEGIPVTAHSSATVFVFTQRRVVPLSARLTVRNEAGSGGEGAGWVVLLSLLPLTIETRRGSDWNQVTQELTA